MLEVTPGINMTVQEGDAPSLATDENVELSMSVENAGSGGGLVNSVDGKIGDVEVLPTGGTAGQVLKKASEADYDVEWADESGGGGAVTSVNGKTGVVVLDADDVGAGTYSKPSGGIPKTDLASAVQTSLGKADTALQTAPVASVNGQTGAVTLTIPSTASDVGAEPVTTVVNKTASDTSQTLAENTFYIWPEMSALTITCPATGGPYAFRFTSGSTATTLTMTGITMPNDFAVEENKVYEINVFEGCGIAASWGVSNS